MTEQNNRLKSNLNIKKRRHQAIKKRRIINARKNLNDEKTYGANIIFGLDNGTTGTISCMIKYPDGSFDIYFQKTPNKIAMDYQQDIQYISRIDWKKLQKWFKSILLKIKKNYIKKYKFLEQDLKILIVLERPMINATRFKQSKNAARAFEAMLIVFQMLGLENNYIIIDSKKWQHYFFGKNTTLIDLKNQSKNKGIEFLSMFKNKYNNLIKIIKSHGDADSLLISKFALEKLCKK